MSYLNVIKLEKYKKSIVISIIFLVFISLFYQLIFNKVLYLLEIDEKIKDYKDNINKLESEEKEIEGSYEKLALKIKKLEEQNKKIKKEFNSVVEFEYFINEELKKNLLQLVTMGRIEVDESSNYYFPYIFQGKLLNLIKFFKSIEDSKFNIFLDKTSFIIETGKISIFEGKIGVKINNKTGKTKKKLEKISIYDLSSKEVVETKIITFDYTNYIIIRYLDNTTLLLREGETIKIGKDDYNIKVKNNNIFFNKKYGK